MKGKIKSFLSDKKFGFIKDDASGTEYFFHVSALLDQGIPVTDGADVEFDVKEVAGRLQAYNVRILGSVLDLNQKTKLSGSPGDYFLKWAFFPMDDLQTQKGETIESGIKALAKLALKEKWHFGPDDSTSDFGILKSYLRFTFYRLWKEDKVIEQRSASGGWAAFNTGLVSKLFDPIYALFEKNSIPTKPWKFFSFCVPGIGPAGKRLTSLFSPLPQPAQYFSRAEHIFFDPSSEIHPQFDHIVEDGISRDRFPQDFLLSNLPKGFDSDLIADRRSPDRIKNLEQLSIAISEDNQCYRSINNRIRDAIELAQKRARWNYKTAIPHYFPTTNQMSLLLPLALFDDMRVDVALVIQKQPSGAYNGYTVLPLSWAYGNARLVCRPDSDWLTTKVVEEANLEQA